MAGVNWQNEVRRLGELKPWAINPREIDDESAVRLAESFRLFGQAEPILIGPDNEIYNGHQRYEVLMEEKGKEFEVEVRVSERVLSEDERKQLTVYLHKGAVGKFNIDKLLANFDTEQLFQWGFEPGDLLITTDELYTGLGEAREAFEPNLEPKLGARSVTDDEVEREQERMENRYNDNTGDESEYVSITCPECGNDFYVRKSDIK